MSQLAPSAHARNIPSLDGLRTISVVFVMLGHLYGTVGYPQNALTHQAGRFAHFGVEVFFVISGFLITTLLLREREQTGRIDLVNFYLRRTFRIFPAAFFYITVMALVVHPGYLRYAYTYTMCYASQARPWVLGHLWSLSVEEQFYLLWPAALMLGFARRRRIGWFVVAITPFLRLGFWVAGMHEIDEYFPAVADSLIMGCLLAMYRDDLRRRAAWLKNPVVFVGLGLAAMSTVLVTRVRLEIAFHGLTPFLVALFLFAAIERADPILNNRVMGFLGVLSYSLYLWQQPFLNRHLHMWWTAFPLNVVLVFLCAVGSYFAVERPFLAFYRGRRTRRAVTATA
jgi:peptidoglycan/LPS O-acetylase OafA/YrhL